MVPAKTASPPYLFTPNLCPWESLPFLELPTPFLCAIFHHPFYAHYLSIDFLKVFLISGNSYIVERLSMLVSKLDFPAKGGILEILTYATFSSFDHRASSIKTSIATDKPASNVFPISLEQN
jgi:hypothetical protein